jgi:hypothetical protein
MIEERSNDTPLVADRRDSAAMLGVGMSTLKLMLKRRELCEIASAAAQLYR